MEKYQELFDLFAHEYNKILLQSEMDAIIKACEHFYVGHGGAGVTEEQIKEAAFKNANEFPHYFTETSHNVAFHYGATWANDQNAARIAELEAMLSKSAFDLDGHIILLQAANQQIEKERKRIAELEAQKAELEDHVTKLADGSFKLLEQRTYLLQVYNRLAATFGIEPKARRALDLVGFDIEKDFPKK